MGSLRTRRQNILPCQRASAVAPLFRGSVPQKKYITKGGLMSTVNYSLKHKGVRLISAAEAWVVGKNGKLRLNSDAIGANLALTRFASKFRFRIATYIILSTI